MRIEVRNGYVVLDGYVNAVGRDSRELSSPHGKFVEQIKPGVFTKAIERAQNVNLLLNHDKQKKLGSTKEGNLELFEDNIGLRAICKVTDPHVIEKAKKKQLRGWSFGMHVTDDEMEERANSIPRRNVNDLELEEVSIIDDTMIPCYYGTSIEERADKEIISETRGYEFMAVTEDNSEKKEIKYDDFVDRIEKLKK